MQGRTPIAHEIQHAQRGDAVEGPVGKRQRTDVGLREARAVNGHLSFADHAERAIDAHNRDARPTQAVGEPALATACVEQRLSLPKVLDDAAQ